MHMSQLRWFHTAHIQFSEYTVSSVLSKTKSDLNNLIVRSSLIFSPYKYQKTDWCKCEAANPMKIKIKIKTANQSGVSPVAKH